MNKELISDYYLERYALNELPDQETKEMHQLVSKDPELQAVLKDIEVSNREILSLYSPSTVKARLLARMNERPNRSVECGLSTKAFPTRRILYISSALVTVALLFILIFPELKKETELKPEDTGKDISLVKGTPTIDLSKTQLLVFRKIKEDVEILTDGNLAQPGDLLQLGYVATGEPYGMILSIDGRGAISLHYPAEKEGSTDLVMNKQSLLPNAIELDDAPGFERFFFLTSKSPIDVESILKKAENLAKNPENAAKEKMKLPDKINQYSVLIRKGEDA